MLAVCGLVVIADQAVKAAIVASMVPGEHTDLALGFQLTRVTNSGMPSGSSTRGATRWCWRSRPSPWR